MSPRRRKSGVEGSVGASAPVLSSGDDELEETSDADSTDPLNEFFVSADERQRVARGASTETVDSGKGHGEEIAELLAFWAADEEYALPIVEIQEIIKVPGITSVPRASSAVLGIISLRGTIVPVVDLRQLLGLEAVELTRGARILVVRGDDDPVGYLVDRVSSVVRLATESIEPVPRTMQREASQLLAGVGKDGDRMLILLDLAAVLAVTEQS